MMQHEEQVLCTILRDDYLYNKGQPRECSCFLARLLFFVHLCHDDITSDGGVSGPSTMPGKAHAQQAMPTETLVTIAVVAPPSVPSILGILSFLVRVLIDVSPGPVYRRVSGRPVAVPTARLEHWWPVEDALVILSVKLEEECLPLLDELEGK